MDATNVLASLGSEANQSRLRLSRRLRQLLSQGLHAVRVLLGVDGLEGVVLLSHHGPEASLLVLAGVAAVAKLLAAGELVRVAVGVTAFALLLAVGISVLGRLFLGAEAGVDEEGDVAHAEGLESGDRGADEAGIDLDEAPDELLREVPGVVDSVQKRVGDDGSLDGSDADTRQCK